MWCGCVHCVANDRALEVFHFCLEHPDSIHVHALGSASKPIKALGSAWEHTETGGIPTAFLHSGFQHVVTNPDRHWRTNGEMLSNP